LPTKHFPPNKARKTMAKDFQEQENGKFGAKVVEWYPAKKLRFDTTFVTIIGSDLSDNKGNL
jgi:hypothetical protein